MKPGKLGKKKNRQVSFKKRNSSNEKKNNERAIDFFVSKLETQSGPTR